MINPPSPNRDPQPGRQPGGQGDTASDPHHSDSHAPHAPQAETDSLVLTKPSGRFVFRCAPGDEAQLMRRLSDLARDPDQDFDWYDAARVSHRLGQRLQQTVRQSSPKH